jgi:hypothetical protein
VGLQAQLWRGIAAFRFASLAYAAVLLVVDRADYDRLVLAWAVLAGMTGWTVATSYAYAVPARRTRALLTADVAVTAAALLSRVIVNTCGSRSFRRLPAGPVGAENLLHQGRCSAERHRRSPASGAWRASLASPSVR